MSPTFDSCSRVRSQEIWKRIWSVHEEHGVKEAGMLPKDPGAAQRKAHSPRLQRYRRWNFVRQHAHPGSAGTKALASGSARFPRRNLFASVPSPAERRVNRLISKHSPLSICEVFKAAAAARKSKGSLPPTTAEQQRNHKSAQERGYLCSPAGRLRGARPRARASAPASVAAWLRPPGAPLRTSRTGAALV